MEAFGRLSSYITQGVYTVSAPFHPFGGAVDIIVVQQQDGSLKSSPWYVQFGKFQGVLKTQEKVVKILVNEADAGFHMYLDHKGEAFFLKESEIAAADVPMTSPPTLEDETDGGPQMQKSHIPDFESNQMEFVSKIDVENGKIVARTNSRRSKIFGFFGRRSIREDSNQDQVNIQRLNSLESAEMAADLLEMKWSTNLPTARITGRNLPKPRSIKDDNEETSMNVAEKGSLSSGKDPDSCSQGRNLPQSPLKKDDGDEFNMNIDVKRSLSIGEDPNPCSQGNNISSGAVLANMNHSGPMDITEGPQCVEPQEEEMALHSSETSASVYRDERIADMPVFSDGHTGETVIVESKEITSLHDTILENSDETLKGPLSGDYGVKTVILDTEIKLPQDAFLENSDKALEGPSVIAPVNNEEKTSEGDTVLEKFQAIEVPSLSRNYTVQSVISNIKENAADDGNTDVSRIRNPNLDLNQFPQDAFLENSDKAIEGPLVIALVNNEKKTSEVDTVLEKFQACEVPSLSRNYTVQTEILNCKENAADDGNTDFRNPDLDLKQLPEDAFLENSDKALEGPSVIAPVNNEEKTSEVDTVHDKFQAFEVPSLSRNYTVQTEISNSNENAADDGNTDVPGFRNPDLDLKQLPEDAFLENSVKALEGPSVIALVNNEEKTSEVDSVHEKFQAFEVSSLSRNYTVETVISNSKQNAADDGNTVVSGIRNPALDLKQLPHDAFFEISDEAIGGLLVITPVNNEEKTSEVDTDHEKFQAFEVPSLSRNYTVQTVISNSKENAADDGNTDVSGFRNPDLDPKQLPEDAFLENSDKALEGPSLIATVNNEEKTSEVDTVLEKFQACEVPSLSRNYTVQTVISSSKENAADDGKTDVSGFRNPDLDLKLSVQESEDISVSSCVIYGIETYETSTVMLDFVNDELQPSGPTRDTNELVVVNDQESYGTSEFVPEVNLTPEPTTPATLKHLVDHNSPCIENLNCYGDMINLERGALKNPTECGKTKSSDSECKNAEMQPPSGMDVEGYESIVKILQENVVHLENEEKEDDTIHDKNFETQVQAEEKGFGIETFQHFSCSGDVESKSTTLLSIAKMNNRVKNIAEEVATGGVDNSVEIVSVTGCAPDNCSNSDPVATADDKMPNSSEGHQFTARSIDIVASNGPTLQQLIVDVNLEENLPHARMKDQDSMLASVDDNRSSDDCYDASRNQSSEIRSPTSAGCIGSNAFIQSRSSGVSSDISNSNDLIDDSFSISFSNQLSSDKTNAGKNETCTFSDLEEGSVRQKIDQASNASLTDPDICSIAEAIKVAKLAVEVSLCRHLLFEGMGEEAASRAFDAEKLNLEKFAAAGPAIVKNSRLIVKIGCHYFPWEAAAPIILGLSSFDRGNIFESEGAIPVEKVNKSAEQDPPKAVIPLGSWKIWPFGSTKPKEKGSEDKSPDGSKENGTAIGSDDVFSDIKNMSNNKDMKKICLRTPSSKQLASLNLKEGRNSVTFTFETAMLGRQQVDARIYLWKWNTRIVISDVDGTITKSDVLGQFMPLVGKDWTQTGVAHLFSAIKENGYQFIFLSARSISQAYITRQFLFNLKQDGKALPDGPVVISPDGLFPSLYREVIRRAPHEFKISCLEDIKALFPPDCNPFYAGFGNRHTDEISYVKVGVPKGKIFTINPRGEVVVNRTVDTKSYVSLHALVDAMFPPTNSSEQEDFNSWNFWKPSLPDVKI